MKGKPLIGGVLAVGTKRSTPSRTTLKRQNKSLGQDVIVSFPNGVHLIGEHFAQTLG